MPRTSDVIAIVDDDPSVLKAMARLLSTRSFVARTFQSAKQFLGSLSDGRPDYLILDLQMPEMNGLELQQNLNNRGIRIPTIIITAHDDAGTRERCKSAGALAYLLKPVQAASLFAAIAAADRSAEP